MKVKQEISNNTLKSIYYTKFDSHLNYGNLTILTKRH